jgi:hypothetical protein
LDAAGAPQSLVQVCSPAVLAALSHKDRRTLEQWWVEHAPPTDSTATLERIPRTSLDVLQPRLREALARALAPGETLRWVERPDPGRYARGGPAGLMRAGLAGLALTSILFGILAAVIEHQVGMPLAAVGVPITPLGLFAAGIGLGVLPILSLRRTATRIAYAITDRRALILGPGRRVRSLSPDQLRLFRRVQHADGSGNLLNPAGASGLGFYAVRNVAALDDLIHHRFDRLRPAEVSPAEPPAGRGNEVTVAPGNDDAPGRITTEHPRLQKKARRKPPASVDH